MSSFHATAGEAPRRILMLVYPDVLLLDFGGPAQVFEQANELAREAGQPEPYRIELASLTGGIVPTDIGFGVNTMKSGDDDGPIDTLLIPGGPGIWSQIDAGDLTRHIAMRARRSRRIAAVCIGAFLAGAAGLLDGRRAVTHWRHCADLARRHPDTTVEVDPIFLQDGPLWTSAGVSAGIDLALALVEVDLGHAMAIGVARRLVVFLKRPGGQAQFSAALAAQQADGAGRFDRLHAWMAENLAGDLRVDQLAEQAGMSVRSFIRTYPAATGRTPAKAVELLRIEAAKRLLVTARLPIATIAHLSGFGDDERLRRAFQRSLGITAEDYRARFAAYLPSSSRVTARVSLP
ncbi:MAG TPA: helix-turn-helix domain-containing protein [Aliidongia sp.]|uniref:GlxA family transcriptional regulator n=1 Tax=Aliidongia sp. TaxID=1914230 RepID=UPI002DDD6A72|nr:helix-turn-helix domain-containing protein [Aliidongia sp.]HEV2673748.1 helix-turn-helix domain-containing protein [Aliidongia sp.]